MSEQVNNLEAQIAKPKPLLAVFVAHPEGPSKLYSHLLILVKTASTAFPDLPAVRLVPLPLDAEARLSEALKLPRIGLVGLQRDAPGISALAELIEAEVPELVVPWLPESKAGVYLPTKINATYCVSGVNQSKVVNEMI